MFPPRSRALLGVDEENFASGVPIEVQESTGSCRYMKYFNEMVKILLKKEDKLCDKLEQEEEEEEYFRNHGNIGALFSQMVQWKLYFLGTEVETKNY